ncbi:hypothetical protein PQX77_018154, partial [Marasmius sp. AFHP31]
NIVVLTQWGTHEAEDGHRLSILDTPRRESTSNPTTGAWREHGIESVLQRITNEDTQGRVLENSDTISATKSLVEDVANQARPGEGYNSTSNGIGSTIEASSGSIIPMYSRPPSQDTITSTTPNGGGDADVQGYRCHMSWYRMEVLLSQYTLYGELCCVAELLDALAEHAQADNHFSSPSLSRVSSDGTSRLLFKRFRNWWATRKPYCGDKEVFPRAPFSLCRDQSLSNGHDSGYESKLNGSREQGQGSAFEATDGVNGPCGLVECPCRVSDISLCATLPF